MYFDQVSEVLLENESAVHLITKTMTTNNVRTLQVQFDTLSQVVNITLPLVVLLTSYASIKL